MRRLSGRGKWALPPGAPGAAGMRSTAAGRNRLTGSTGGRNDQGTGRGAAARFRLPPYPRGSRLPCRARCPQIAEGGHREQEAQATLQPPDEPGGPQTAGGQSYPIGVDVCVRRMFVVGDTPGGAPYGIFEDQMEAATDNLVTAEDADAY